MHRKVRLLQSRVEERAVEGAQAFFDDVASGEIPSFTVIGQTRQGDVRVLIRGSFERNLLAAIGACRHGADVINDLLKNSLFEQFGDADPANDD